MEGAGTPRGLAGAGRYVLEERLAEGGTGVIYRARDAATGELYALKRHKADAAELAGGPLLLKREYHMLSQLSHPRIIRVYDYGVDAEGPYYTMELLDGADMRALSPLPYRSVCEHLRDVASSLALLHARRLMHRDVSPANVRATSDGRAKLIDFGSTEAFGVPRGVVGTPPCVAPETLAGRHQDHRTDLYALGALAYFMLTGRHAYPARRLADLAVAWKQPPPPPGQVVASQHDGREIPAALDRLVLSLLHRDPLARPASAAEVIDRLEAIAGLPSERSEQAAQSYLRGTPLLGRKTELDRLRRRLRSALRGRGGAVWIEAPSGMGRTRLLSELTVEAQLRGALVLQADAELHSEPYACIRALLTQLLRNAPSEARAAAASRAEVLCHLLPDLGRELDRELVPAAVPDAPGEWRLRLHAALLSWVIEVARARRLLIVVDNLCAVEDASLSCLAALSHEARAAGLLLVTAIRSDRQPRESATLRAMAARAERMKLAPLTADHVRKLTRALFDDAPHARRLAERLHDLSAGSPRHCLELVQLLLARGLVRFVDGVWVLPQSLPADVSSSDPDQVLAGRLQALSPPARELAEALSVTRDVIPIEQCLALGGASAPARLFAALDELVSTGVLSGVCGGYRFTHAAVRKGLYDGLPSARRRQLHGAAGQWLLLQHERGTSGRLQAGLHLLEAGDADAADLLAEAGLELANGSDAMAEAVPALEAALSVYRARKRGPHALVSLLVPLTMAGYFVDRRLSLRYGEETTALLERLTGLRLARALQPLLGRRMSTYAGLLLGMLRHALTPRSRIRHGFQELVTMLLTCVTARVSVAAICLDPWSAGRLLHVLEPLAALGRSHPAYAVYQFCRYSQRTVQDRAPSAVRGMMRIYRHTRDATRYPALPAEARDLLKNNALYAAGALKSQQDNEGALRHAELLEQTGSPLYGMVAQQLRMVYHAYRGELSKAEAHREKVELYAIQAGSAWQVEVWSPCTMCAVYLNTGDVIGLKRTIEQLEQVASEIPTLERYLHFARGGYHLLRGDGERAVELFRASLSGASPREFIGWTTVMAFLAAAYNAQGRYERAREAATEAIAQLGDADYAFPTANLRVQIELCLAEAGMGESERALARLEQLLADHAAGDGPVTLGSLHQARARIGLRIGDVATFRASLEAMGRHFRPTKHPSLIAQCEQLEAEAVQAGLFESARRRRINPSAVLLANAGITRSILRACKSPEERAERALHLLIERCDASGGFLYLCSAQGPVLVAPRHGEEPPPELERAVMATAERFLQEADTTAHAGRMSLSPAAAETQAERGSDFTPIVLGTNATGTFVLVGIAALLHPERPLTVPNYDMLEAVARTLCEAGDLAAFES